MWLADDDELCDEDHVSKLVAHFETDSTANLVFPEVSIFQGKNRSETTEDLHQVIFGKCATDADYLTAFSRFGGGYPFYGLYRVDYLKSLRPAKTLDRKLIYFNEGIFLHRAFLRGGIRFCSNAMLMYNADNSSKKHPL